MISYDLNKKDKNYEELYGAIKSYETWWHQLTSSWLIDTQEDAAAIFNKLKPHIDTDDTLLVIRVTKDYNGWLTDKAWEWIRNRTF